MLKPFAIFFAGIFASPAPAPVKPAPAQTLVVAPKRVAQAPTAAEILAGVQKFYAGITGVEAKFRQEVTNATFGRTDISDGQVFISKPGKMRWNYFAKPKKGKPQTLAKEFISDGNYLYVVDHENKQIIEKDLRQNLLPTAITFLYGKGDLAADFTPTLDTSGTYGSKGDLVLKLTPKQPSAQYKHLFLVVNPSDFRVKESILIDAANNKNHFRFYEPNFQPTFDKTKTFAFSTKAPAVKSYRVVKGDQPAPAPSPTPPTKSSGKVAPSTP